jgi:tetratricopeptide (TPR) repeat protein
MSDPRYYFEKAIEADPTFSPPYYWLASYYCKIGRREESIEYFEKFLQVVDECDPHQKGRIDAARCFIGEMKAGNCDYNSIAGKTMR